MTQPVVWREPVQDAWIDYNGHLSEAYYVLVLGHATDAVMDAVGLGPEYRTANDASLYTVEAHVQDALAKGARALTGGTRGDGDPKTGTGTGPKIEGPGGLDVDAGRAAVGPHV